MSWASATIASSTCHGTLTLGGVLMNTTTRATLNNYILWNSATRRGENTLIPGVDGRIPHPKRKDESVRTLEGLVIGASGSSSSLASNWFVLKNGLLMNEDPITASLLLPNGSTISGLVQIQDSALGETGTTGALTFTIDLVLPYGELS